MPSPPVMFLCAAGIGLAALLYYYFSAREERERYAYETSSGGSRGGRQRRYESKYELEECSICQEIVYNVVTLRTLSCGHRFHHRCIEKWFEASPHPTTCPNCRQAAH